MPKFVYNNNFDYLEKGVAKNSFLHIIGELNILKKALFITT